MPEHGGEIVPGEGMRCGLCLDEWPCETRKLQIRVDVLEAERDVYRDAHERVGMERVEAHAMLALFAGVSQRLYNAITIALTLDAPRSDVELMQAHLGVDQVLAHYRRWLDG